MINYFGSRYHISRKRLFAARTSGGGHAAYQLPLPLPDKFNAIIAVMAKLPDTNNIDCIVPRKN